MGGRREGGREGRGEMWLFLEGVVILSVQT